MSVVSFGEFMQESLYGDTGKEQKTLASSSITPQETQKGYYANPHRVGKQGDFYTSVSVSRFFGGAIAQYILDLLEDSHLTLPLTIVEIGADKGYLLSDIAQFLDALSFNVLPQCQFCTIEPFLTLQEAQHSRFSTLKLSQNTTFKIHHHLDALLNNSSIKQRSLIFVSNELFDSFKCEIITPTQMLYIQREKNQWHGIWNHTPQDIIQKAQDYGISSGVLPFWEDFITHIATISQSYKIAYFLSFDYGNFSDTFGDARDVRFYASHQVENLDHFLKQNGNFQTLYQKTDITYNVNFSLLSSLFEKHHFTRIFQDTQAQILIQKMRLFNLLESFKESMTNEQYIREINKVKTLILTMGEKFKGFCYKINT